MQPGARPEITHYTYRVTWSAADHEFVATCAEFPSLSWLAPPRSRLCRGFTTDPLLRDVIADREEQGEQVP